MNAKASGLVLMLLSVAGIASGQQVQPTRNGIGQEESPSVDGQDIGPLGVSVVAKFQYAAKFVCGGPAGGQMSPPTLVAGGRYFSQTNVHNPSRYQTVVFRKKFAVALPFERAGTVSRFFEGRLKPDEALQIDCGDIFGHLGLAPTAFVEGFAVIESPLELDVDTFYTAGVQCDFEVSAIHTERVQPRRLESCNRLDLDLTAGSAPWQVVAESHPGSFPLPRPASVYPMPGGQAIGGLPKVDAENAGQWWDFELCFCLCSGAQDVQLNLTAATIDDQADFWLNWKPIGSLALLGLPATTFSLQTINSAAGGHFQPGQNCLRMRLTNTFPTQAYLRLAGSITGTDAACPVVLPSTVD
jgi:hypothetical protein